MMKRRSLLNLAAILVVPLLGYRRRGSIRPNVMKPRALRTSNDVRLAGRLKIVGIGGSLHGSWSYPDSVDR